jgi:hypothetical protein
MPITFASALESTLVSKRTYWKYLPLRTFKYPPLLCTSTLDLDPRPMHRTPNASHALVQTRHRLAKLLRPFTTCISQKFRLLSDAFIGKITDAYRLLLAIDVVADHDGVFVRSWRDGYLDLRVPCGEGGERVSDEGVHTARGAGPVAVVEVKTLALEDEGADAVLVNV